MDWIVFGDDWGAHPSTTQHLVRSLPDSDRVIWVDSIGMRSPKLSVDDAKRAWTKARGMMSRGDRGASPGSESDPRQTMAHIKPKVIPYHLDPAAQKINAWSLGRDIGRQMEQLGIEDPILLSSLPVVAPYLEQIPHRKFAYLRLDDYARLPGCDRQLIEITEERIFAQADAVIGTARALLPTGPWASKGHYLPQGVDWEHFATASIEPSGNKVLGFFGLLAEWMDFELIETVAREAPEWRLEFIGPVRHLPDRLRSVSNLRFLPGVPFAELPGMMSDWTAAWIPFEVSELTEAVNPLKAREYLAAGLATHCTPLPEVAALEEAFITDRADEIVAWLTQTLQEDSHARRKARRESVRGDSWRCRANQLAEIMRET